MPYAELKQLPKIADPRGNLSFFENCNQIPFEIKRAYWIYDVPGGETRGGHAYKKNKEFIVALSGSFDVVIDDGNGKKIYSLNRSYNGLFVSEGCWREMENFSTNSLALVVSSENFSEADYIRDYNEFRTFATTERVAQNTLSSQNDSAVSEDATREAHTARKIAAKKSKVFDCSIVELPINHRVRGNLTVVENAKTLPFDVKRCYYLYDVPAGETRGGHAHKELRQLIIAASGSFDVVLDDGEVKRTFTLNRPFQGLLVVPGIWRDLNNFSSGSVCLVMASEVYTEDDYIREYKDFLEWKKTV